MRKHLYIPDCQVTPDVPVDHLEWIGHYIIEKKPDVIVNGGDFGDMESLCSYDVGKKQYEGRRYRADIEASKNGMETLLKPINDYNAKMIFQKGKQYKPEMHLTLGNHEYRIERAIENDPKMDGFMGLGDLEYESYGWTVHPFLKIIEIDGLSYSHYFCNPLSGRPYGGENIMIRLKNIGFSFVAGHQQVYMSGTKSLNNGKRLRGVVLGACYLHDELYRGNQCNNEWRGILIFHEVKNGDYSLMEISLDYLCRRYEGIPLWEFMQKKYPKLFQESTWMQYQKQAA